MTVYYCESPYSRCIILIVMNDFIMVTNEIDGVPIERRTIPEMTAWCRELTEDDFYTMFWYLESSEFEYPPPKRTFPHGYNADKLLQIHWSFKRKIYDSEEGVIPDEYY